MYRGRTFSLSLPPFTKAVKWLVLINAAVYLLMLALQAFDAYLQGMIFAALSLIPSLVVHGWIYQLVTYAFLHDGFWHIGGNMLGLWMFGSAMESEWGARKFTGILFLLRHRRGPHHHCGRLFRPAQRQPQRTDRGRFGRDSGHPDGIRHGLWGPGDHHVSAADFFQGQVFRGHLGFFTLVNAISVANPSQGGARIAYAAHLGGLLFGFLYVKFLPKRGLLYGASERYFGVRNSYYRWKRRRAARKFEVYMREHNRNVTFDEHGNYIPDEDRQEEWRVEVGLGELGTGVNVRASGFSTPKKVRELLHHYRRQIFLSCLSLKSQIVPRAFHREQLVPGRNQLQRGLHFLDCAKRISRPVDEQCRSLQIWKVLGSELLWLGRRMQRIRQQQQAVHQSRCFRAQHGRLAPAVGMSTQENAARDHPTHRGHSVLQAFAVARCIPGPWRPKAPHLPKRQIAPQDDKARAGEGLCHGREQSRLRVCPGPVRQYQAITVRRDRPAQKSPDRRVKFQIS